MCKVVEALNKGKSFSWLMHAGRCLLSSYWLDRASVSSPVSGRPHAVKVRISDDRREVAVLVKNNRCC